ncbi:hypothetical protein AAVH_35334 [Aphelenchoides avenae]|nr:hypothetical protein AAVH_35334 [Aphelenchus avenae]
MRTWALAFLLLAATLFRTNEMVPVVTNGTEAFVTEGNISYPDCYNQTSSSELNDLDQTMKKMEESCRALDGKSPDVVSTLLSELCRLLE